MLTRRARLAAFVAQASAREKDSGPLQISGLRPFPVREPESGRRYTILKIATRAGISGYGETSDLTGPEMVEALRVIQGRQATAFAVFRRELAGMPGVRAAVDMALLDIVGQHVKAPVYQVLGGPTRNKARALARLSGATDEALLAECRRARQAGFRAFMVPVPTARPLVPAAERRMNALRAETGEDMDFVLDAAATLTPGEAAGLSAAFERFHLLWFDEPCPVSNLAAVRKLSAERVTPLGFGRRIRTGGAFQDLLREEAIDILRPDIAFTGISEIRRMAVLAETYYVAVAPHHEGGPVSTAAALHLAASLPNFFIQQIPLPCRRSRPPHARRDRGANRTGSRRICGSAHRAGSRHHRKRSGAREVQEHEPA